MATIEEIAPGKLFRHKGGKLYKVCASYQNAAEPRWNRDFEQLDPQTLTRGRIDQTKVDCVQWQVNDKHPQGREYQASRMLRLADLTAA